MAALHPNNALKKDKRDLILVIKQMYMKEKENILVQVIYRNILSEEVPPYQNYT